MNSLYLFALANLVLCGGVAFIAFCRLNAMHGGLLIRVRSEYAVYLGAAVVAGFQPWWGEWPGWGSLVITGAMLLGLICSSHAWRDGPPETTKGEL